MPFRPLPEALVLLASMPVGSLAGALLLLVGGSPPAPVAPAREHVSYALYKWQHRIGEEHSTVVHGSEGMEVRTTFTFTDRSTPVALSSLLELTPDGTPRRFQIWGRTSRATEVDDRVVVSDNILTIAQGSKTRTEATPPRFFVGSAYAPMILTEELWRYWKSHGSPQQLRVIPLGDVNFEHRGLDSVSDDDGKTKTLDRWAVTGIGWGRETLWFDGDGRLAAAKMVDAEFDHFEATRKGYSQALSRLVASAAADGMAQLAEASRPLGAESGSRTLAIVGATLIDATGAPPMADSVVLIEGSRIRAVGPKARVPIPAGAQRLDATGKTLLPGLWDMHAHFEQVEWGPLYLAAGVTTVRDCGNELDFIRSVRDAVDSNKGLGPRILLACIVDSPGDGSIGTDLLRSAAQIPALIKKFQEAGCAQVKVYSNLDPQLLRALARAAHAAGMTVTGHIPEGIGIVHAVEDVMDMVNHLSFVVRALLPASYGADKPLPRPVFLRAMDEMDLASQPATKTLAFLARRQVVVDPTVALSELSTHTHEELVAIEPGLAKVAVPLREPLGSMGVLSEDAAAAHRRWATMLAVLRALHRAGVPIVAGTDQAIPGHSLYRELEIYVDAGFTPLEAIQAATAVPARVMRRERDLGTVAPGKLADLILVDGDPLTDIRTLRRVTSVVIGGRVYDTAALWRSVGFQP
jgi:imidazolonepropionase-like amidohydrolase